jgi:hypothetical protein
MRSFPISCVVSAFNICADRLTVGYLGCICGNRQITQVPSNNGGILGCSTKFYCPGSCDHELIDDVSPLYHSSSYNEIIRVPYTIYTRNDHGSINILKQSSDSRDHCPFAQDLYIDNGSYPENRFNSDILPQVRSAYANSNNVYEFHGFHMRAPLAQSEWDSLRVGLIEIHGSGGDWTTVFKVSLESQNISSHMLSVIYYSGQIIVQAAPIDYCTVCTRGNLPDSIFISGTETIISARSGTVTEQITIPLAAEWCSGDESKFGIPVCDKTSSGHMPTSRMSGIWALCLMVWIFSQIH